MCNYLILIYPSPQSVSVGIYNYLNLLINPTDLSVCTTNSIFIFTPQLCRCVYVFNPFNRWCRIYSGFDCLLAHTHEALGQLVGSLRDREVACSASDRQGSNFESCVWRTVSSQSSHHPQEVLLAQFSLYVHKGGLKPDSFHIIWCRIYSGFHFLLAHTHEALGQLFHQFMQCGD